MQIKQQSYSFPRIFVVVKFDICHPIARRVKHQHKPIPIPLHCNTFFATCNLLLLGIYFIAIWNIFASTWNIFVAIWNILLLQFRTFFVAVFEYFYYCLEYIFLAIKNPFYLLFWTFSLIPVPKKVVLYRMKSFAAQSVIDSLSLSLSALWSHLFVTLGHPKPYLIQNLNYL